VSVSANAWTRLSVANVTVPATAVRVLLEVVGGGAGAWSTGQTLDCTGVDITPGATVRTTYMDGDSPWISGNMFYWDGSIGRSTSSVRPWSNSPSRPVFAVLSLDPMIYTGSIGSTVLLGDPPPVELALMAYMWSLSGSEYPTEMAQHFYSAVASRTQVVQL
jgi:hypothetical protein